MNKLEVGRKYRVRGYNFFWKGELKEIKGDWILIECHEWGHRHQNIWINLNRIDFFREVN